MSDADDMADEAGFFCGQAERAADEPGTDDDHSFEEHVLPPTEYDDALLPDSGRICKGSVISKLCVESVLAERVGLLVRFWFPEKSARAKMRRSLCVRCGGR